jgi:hypothetical protein
MNGGPFPIDQDHKSVLRKAALQGNGRMLIDSAD